MSAASRKVLARLAVILFLITFSAFGESWVRVQGEIPAEEISSVELDKDSVVLNTVGNAEYFLKTYFSNVTGTIITRQEMSPDGRRRNVKVTVISPDGKVLSTNTPGSTATVDWSWGPASKIVQAAASKTLEDERWKTFCSDGSNNPWCYDQESIVWNGNASVSVWILDGHKQKSRLILYSDRTVTVLDRRGKPLQGNTAIPIPPESIFEALWKIFFK
jgi:hypothetical protein